jgi:hypothetical protein
MITSTNGKKIKSPQLCSIPKSKCLLIIISLCFQLASATYAQDSLIKTAPGSSPDTNKTTVSEDSSTVSNIAPATYPGGKTEWLMYLVRNVVVPEELRGTKFNRSIVVKFTVDEKGRLRNFEDRGNDILKKEAIRVVKASGKWKPASSNSKPIASECERSITFQWN